MCESAELYFLLVCNDVMVYVCGFFFGRTPIFRLLSANKMWEGCIGGAVLTVVCGVLVSMEMHWFC